MSESAYLVVLRLLHIGCGIFWAGAAIYLSFFVDPAIKALGTDGPKFMQQLVRTNRFPVVILFSALITVVAGALLIWKLSGGFQSKWLSTSYGMVLTGGAVFAIIAFLIGFTVNRPSGMRMAKIAQTIAIAGGVATPVQLGELKMLSQKISVGSRIIAILLILAVIGMSVFRYV